MKMITAIINKRDAGEVCDALSESRFSFTKMATMLKLKIQILLLKMLIQAMKKILICQILAKKKFQTFYKARK